MVIKRLEDQLTRDKILEQQLQVGSKDAVRLSFEQVAQDMLHALIDSNFKFYKKVQDDQDIARELFDRLFERYYARKASGPNRPARPQWPAVTGFTDQFRRFCRRRARIIMQIRRARCLFGDGTGRIVLRRQWNRSKTQRMKTIIKSLGAVVLGGGLFISGCAKKQMASFQSLKNPELAAQLKSFVAEKEAQANGVTNKMPSAFQALFAVAARGDWPAVSNAFIELRKQAGQYEHSGKSDERLRDTAWQAVVETWGALEAFGEGDKKYSVLFGTNIIASIPAGSIYFGGTDPGLFIITALQKSQVQAEPFFTLTQGALPDAGYLEYLRGM